jgi:hypothetical protein
MTTTEIAKEKAKELFDKFYSAIPNDEMGENYKSAKQCALIAAEEIIELYEFHAISNPDDKRVMDTLNCFDEVKQEIEKL